MKPSKPEFGKSWTNGRAGRTDRARNTAATSRYILRIKHQLGIAMVWVEHDMQMVADLADRICVLNYGKMLAEGTPDAVLKDARVIEAYLGATV